MKREVIIVAVGHKYYRTILHTGQNFRFSYMSVKTDINNEVNFEHFIYIPCANVKHVHLLPLHTYLLHLASKQSILITPPPGGNSKVEWEYLQSRKSAHLRIYVHALSDSGNDIFIHSSCYSSPMHSPAESLTFTPMHACT